MERLPGSSLQNGRPPGSSWGRPSVKFNLGYSTKSSECTKSGFRVGIRFRSCIYSWRFLRCLSRNFAERTREFRADPAVSFTQANWTLHYGRERQVFWRTGASLRPVQASRRKERRLDGVPVFQGVEQSNSAGSASIPPGEDRKRGVENQLETRG